METKFRYGYSDCYIKCIIFVPNFMIMSKLNYFIQKAILIFAFVISSVSMMNAQWVSPGNGTTYIIEDLVELSNGCVIWSESNNSYRIENDVTISANDKLVVNHSINFGNNVTLTIKGSIEAINTDTYYWLSFSGNYGVNGRIRLEDATAPCVFRRCYITQLDGIQVIESEAVFTDCHFQNFRCEQQSAVVDCMNCDPVFTNCNFDNNSGSAISSPANGQTSPQITDCIFFLNVSNNPHINLGPGSQDSIRIVNCTINDGDYMAGGISIADLMGIGDTKILLKNNNIYYNRYGYNQQGYHLSSTIIGNTFDRNKLETNPMNGGSGISIYGMDENNKAYIRNNVITNNHWGITVINAANVDLGTEDDWGHNVIHGNGHVYNYGASYGIFDLYNNSAYDITAVGNYWGTIDEQEIEEHITHQFDDPSLGLVYYIPFLTEDGVNEVKTTGFEVWPNPISNGSFTLSLKKAVPTEVTIYNVNGQLIKSQFIDNQINTINIEALKSGVYFVEVKNIESKNLKKIIIQ